MHSLRSQWPCFPLLALVSAVALLSGCAVGPDFVKPEAPKDSGYAPTPLPAATASEPIQGGEAQSFIAGKEVPFDWWTLFGSPSLNALVERAFRNNPTIPAAQATLRQAQEMVYAQQGYFFPTVGGEYNFERQQLAGNQGANAPGQQGNGTAVQPSAAAAPVIFNMHTAQLTVGYAPDVFGGNRRQVESLDAQAEQQRYQLQATYVTLASNVVAAAIQEASTRDQIAAVTDIIAANTKTVEILRKQLQNGYATGIDVAQAEAALAQARLLLPPLDKELELTRDLIRALTGNLPNQEVERIANLAALQLPRDLPLSLPSKIIEQRPDVRAAEEQLRSANAQLGVAIAARLPQFSITGAVGGTATQLGQMFSPGGPFWTLISDVTMPIFDGNTLLHRQRASDQAVAQAAEQYRNTVITAYQNVADSLHAIVADAEALKAAGESERAAKVALDLTQRQMQVGYVNVLTLLTAEMTYQQASLSLIQARATRFGDTAALYQSLGGGWWNRGDLAADNGEGDALLDRTKWLAR